MSKIMKRIVPLLTDIKRKKWDRLIQLNLLEINRTPPSRQLLCAKPPLDCGRQRVNSWLPTNFTKSNLQFKARKQVRNDWKRKVEVI